MFLSLDRYVAIRHPVKSRRLCTPCHVTAAIFFIWIVNSVVMAPLAGTKTLVEAELSHLMARPCHYCHEVWSSQTARQLFDGFLFALIFLAPASVVAFSYLSTGFSLLKRDKSLRDQTLSSDSQKRIMAGRRRLALMLLMVAALFLASWLPYTVYNLYLDFVAPGAAGSDPATSVTIAYAVLVVGHSHCAQNPILYCILNRPFKRRLVRIFGCRRSGLSRTQTGECSTKQIEECLQELAREFPGRDPLSLLSKRDSLKLMKSSSRRKHQHQLAKTFSTSSSAPETTGLFDRPTYSGFNSAAIVVAAPAAERRAPERQERRSVFRKLLNSKSRLEVVDLEARATSTTTSTATVVAKAAARSPGGDRATAAAAAATAAVAASTLLLDFTNGFVSSRKRRSPETMPATPRVFQRYGVGSEEEEEERRLPRMQVSLSEPAVTFGTARRKS